MNKRTALLLSGTAALMALNAPQANATTASISAPVASPQSYAELLEPIPNALASLKADNERLSRSPATAKTQLAQYYHHHHHHHHHHHSFFGGGIYLPPPVYAGCYWTYGRPYWNGYAWARPRVRVCP